MLVIIPAHNEESTIAKCLASLQAQSRPPARIVVVADSCADSTAVVARAAGAEVFLTRGNRERKAGALNQALAHLRLPQYVAVIDADTLLAPRFIEIAGRYLAEHPMTGAVGALFSANEPKGFLQWCQANEFARYCRQVERDGKVRVLSGTAAVFRREALEDVGRRGYVYDPDALTEDMEITLALKARGWELASPAACTVETELMPTWRALFTQRVRWYRGALDNLRKYGMTPVTAPYWGQQVGLALAVLALRLYFAWTIYLCVTTGLSFSPFWLAVGALFAIVQVVTAWRTSWSGRVLAALLYPELIYSAFLQWAFVKAIASSARNKAIRWHVQEA